MSVSASNAALPVAGLAALGLAIAVGDTGFAIDAFRVFAVVALLWRASRREPGWWIWLMVGAAIVLSGLSSMAGSGPLYAEELAPGIWMAWGLYFAATTALVVAWAGAARARSGGRDPISLIDGFAIAAAAAVPVWIAWIGPALEATELGTDHVVAALVTPALYLLLIAVGVRTGLGGGTWRLPSLLMIAGLLANTVGDLGYNLMALHGDTDGTGPTDLGWAVAYLCWGLAALHPDAPGSLRPGDSRGGVGAGRRLIVVVFAAALPLGAIAVAHIQAEPVRPLVVLVPLAAMTVLLAIRHAILKRRGAGSRRPALIVAAAGIIAILVGVGLTQAQTSSDRQRTAANRLLMAQAETEAIGYVGSRVANQDAGLTPADLMQLAQRTTRVRQHITSISANDNGVDRAELLALHDRWLLAGTGVFAVLLTGTVDEVDEADKRALAPAHAQLVRALGEASAGYRAGAEADAKRGRIASVVVLLVSLIALCLLLARFGATRRAALAAMARTEAMQESELRFRALIDGSPDVITVIDADTVILGQADAVERVLGYPEGSMHGKRLADLLPPQEAAVLRQLLAALSARPGETETLTGRVRVADGRMIDIEASIVNHADNPHLGGFVVNARDVTERKALQAQIEHQALHDPLTGLPNRALLEDRLRGQFRSLLQPLHTLVLLDVNDFKAINDTLGHSAGDTLLCGVAAQLRAAVGAADLLARVGGDEFAILLDGVESPDEAVTRARELAAVLRQPVDLGNGHPQPVRVSVGVAVSDGGDGHPDRHAEHLLRNAELAMYEAKRDHEGNPVVLFVDEMHAAVAKRLALRNELERGIAEGQLALHYQPIVDLKRMRIAGYEALVRWIHPERGMVSPGEFIPIAEESGLIVDLGRWVLREACRQAAEWQHCFPDERYVSVNVAGQQLQRQDFADEVIDAVRDSGLPPRLLLLEVTETGLIGDSEGNERRLVQLRELGTRLAIDDFGTGYSSLSYLHRFPFDVLKIDKAFIDRVANEEGGRTLVEAMVRMAGSLNLSVVAEGIEEIDQVRTLLDMECANGQGFHFSRPLPAADVPAFALPGESVQAHA